MQEYYHQYKKANAILFSRADGYSIREIGAQS